MHLAARRITKFYKTQTNGSTINRKYAHAFKRSFCITLTLKNIIPIFAFTVPLTK